MYLVVRMKSFLIGVLFCSEQQTLMTFYHTDGQFSSYGRFKVEKWPKHGIRISRVLVILFDSFVRVYSPKVLFSFYIFFYPDNFLSPCKICDEKLVKFSTCNPGAAPQRDPRGRLRSSHSPKLFLYILIRWLRIAWVISRQMRLKATFRKILE